MLPPTILSYRLNYGTQTRVKAGANVLKTHILVMWNAIKRAA
jgi:hypothetical protein